MFSKKVSQLSLLNLQKNSPNPEQTEKKQVKIEKNYVKRQSSMNILPSVNTKYNVSISPISELIKYKKNRTKQLGFAIQKYNIHREKFLKKSNYDLAFDILQVIKQFGDTQNNFQQLFKNLFKDIKHFMLYIDQKLDFAKYFKIQEGQVYKKICADVNSQISKVLKQNEQKIQNLKNQNIFLKTEKQELQKEFTDKEKSYISQIQKLKKISTTDYGLYLQGKIQSLTERILQLQYSQRQLLRELNELQKSFSVQKQQISQHLREIGTLKGQVYDLNEKRKLNEQMVCSLRGRFDQLSLKLAGIRDNIADVQEENEALKSQRIVLVKRGAISFQQLTPRPSYSKAFNFDSIQLQNPLKSTVEITELLLTTTDDRIWKQQFRDQLFKAKGPKHPRLLQAQEIRQRTLESILSAKDGLNLLDE